MQHIIFKVRKTTFSPYCDQPKVEFVENTFTTNVYGEPVTHEKGEVRFFDAEDALYALELEQEKYHGSWEFSKIIKTAFTVVDKLYGAQIEYGFIAEIEEY